MIDLDSIKMAVSKSREFTSDMDEDSVNNSWEKATEDFKKLGGNTGTLHEAFHHVISEAVFQGKMDLDSYNWIKAQIGEDWGDLDWINVDYQVTILALISALVIAMSKDVS